MSIFSKSSIRLNNSTIKNSNIGGSSICMSGGSSKVTVNGKTVQVPSGNVSVINGKIFVDGKEFDTKDTDLGKGYGTVNITIEGNVDKIECNGSVEVKGNVSKGIDCGGSCDITGNVNGDIDSGGSCKIVGEHKGSIDAGGSVSIR